MPLETYISELLYRYDCVIIPEFGAFLTKRISAQIDSENNLFHPPKKVLSFNPQLQHNDGLLCNHIAEVEKIPYGDAVSKIHDLVLEFKEKLDNHESLVFKHVGQLSLSEEKNIPFTPNKQINYLTSSFGLSELNLLEVDRIAHKQQVEAIEEAVPLSISKPQKQSNKWIKYAAAAVVIIGLGGFGAYKYYEKEVNNHNLMVQEAALKEVDAKVQEATFVISNPLPNAVFEVEKQSGNFHIVAGAFRIESNSNKKVKQLQSLGYKARTIGVNKYGLHEVVYSSYQTRAEAQRALRTIRNSHNPEAWLLIKKLD
jgi:hypothetical protein